MNAKTKSSPVKKSPKKKKPAKKKLAAKKVTSKKGVKRAGVKKANPPADKNRSMSKAPVHERRTALVKLLQKSKAVGLSTAISVDQLAKRLKYNSYDVYCLAYHCHLLAKELFLGTDRQEDKRGLFVYLLPKGIKTKFDSPPFVKKAT